MISTILLQIIIVPVITALVLFFFRFQIGKKAGWIAAASLIYTTTLLLIAGFEIYPGGKIGEN